MFPAALFFDLRSCGGTIGSLCPAEIAAGLLILTGLVTTGISLRSWLRGRQACPVADQNSNSFEAWLYRGGWGFLGMIFGGCAMLMAILALG